MGVYQDFLEEPEEERVCAAPARMEHKHWCDGCATYWKHETPCDYATHRGLVEDWPCPMCWGSSDPEVRGQA